MPAATRYGWRGWELFSENKFLVKQVLVANGLAYNATGLNVLEKRIDSRLNLEHHLTSLKDQNVAGQSAGGLRPYRPQEMV